MWKNIFDWYKAAMTDKSMKELEIFSHIVPNTKVLIPFSFSNQVEMFWWVKSHLNEGQTS